MKSTTRTVTKHRAFNWRYSFATAFTVALHAVALLMVLAPVVAPQATERITHSDVPIQLIVPVPEPLQPPPPPPEPPQKPQDQVVHTAIQPPPIPLPPTSPVLVSEPSPMAEVAPPPTPPSSNQVPAEVRASARISYRSKYRPQYPAQAIRMRQEGTVQLKILVDVDGSPLDIQIMGSSGYRGLDHAAIAAARQWKFNPATQNGVPRQGWVIIPVEFSLTNL